jgi:hypothetical protein
MIPPIPSATVPPDSSAHLLLRRGQPFVEFPRFSILDLQRQTDRTGNVVPFSEWLTKRLQIGQPFVIQDFDQLESWDSRFFEIEKLIELSTKKSTSPPCVIKRSNPVFHRHSHPKLQLGEGSQLHTEKVRRLRTPVLPGISEPLRSGPTVSARMARTMPQDTAHGGTMGWTAGSVPVATSMREERGYDGVRRL